MRSAGRAVADVIDDGCASLSPHVFLGFSEKPTAKVDSLSTSQASVLYHHFLIIHVWKLSARPLKKEQDV